MFKICNTVGRVAVANRSQAIRPLCAVLPSNVGNMQFASTPQKADVKFGPLDENIKRLQKKFQEKNDVPVFLKGGPMDQILYRTTMGLCVVGTVLVVHFIVTNVMKKN